MKRTTGVIAVTLVGEVSALVLEVSTRVSTHHLSFMERTMASRIPAVPDSHECGCIRAAALITPQCVQAT